MDGALEAVECHRSVALGDAEGLVIIVTADITLSHGKRSRPNEESSRTTASNPSGSTSAAEPPFAFTMQAQQMRRLKRARRSSRTFRKAVSHLI
jgi:hypothetical protein